MSYDFQTTTHAKWILAGEHAVIREHPALVFAIPSKQLILSYKQTSPDLNASYEGESGADLHMLFWSVLEQGMQLLGKSLNSLSGHFNINSNIPIGVGMGASAALSVAMARWFAAQYEMMNWSIYSFARELENLFHGKSSGLDIAGVSSQGGMYFKLGHATAINQAWSPLWFLSSSGQIGITSHCISQVQTLWEENQTCAQLIDKQMANSVQACYTALQHNAPESSTLLAHAIHKAADCFQQWGLISDNLAQHMMALKEAGAVAVKPTGSGGGGYVLSLWDKPPPPLAFELIHI